MSDNLSHNLEKEKGVLRSICNPFHDKFFDNEEDESRMLKEILLSTEPLSCLLVPI